VYTWIVEDVPDAGGRREAAAARSVDAAVDSDVGGQVAVVVVGGEQVRRVGRVTVVGRWCRRRAVTQPVVEHQRRDEVAPDEVAPDEIR